MRFEHMLYSTHLGSVVRRYRQSVVDGHPLIPVPHPPLHVEGVDIEVEAGRRYPAQQSGCVRHGKYARWGRWVGMARGSVPGLEQAIVRTAH